MTNTDLLPVPQKKVVFYLPQLTRSELQAERDDLVLELKHAHNMMNWEAKRQILKEIMYVDEILSNM